MCIPNPSPRPVRPSARKVCVCVCVMQGAWVRVGVCQGCFCYSIAWQELTRTGKPSHISDKLYSQGFYGDRGRNTDMDKEKDSGDRKKEKERERQKQMISGDWPTCAQERIARWRVSSSASAKLGVWLKELPCECVYMYVNVYLLYAFIYIFIYVCVCALSAGKEHELRGQRSNEVK